MASPCAGSTHRPRTRQSLLVLLIDEEPLAGFDSCGGGERAGRDGDVEGRRRRRRRERGARRVEKVRGREGSEGRRGDKGRRRRWDGPVIEVYHRSVASVKQQVS
eukprot:112508-Hanusia_phi.AAC.2